MRVMRRIPYMGSSQLSFGSGLMTPIVKVLLWTNIAVFILSTLSPQIQYWVNVIFGLTPELVLTRFWIWQPVTYMFLHGGLTHILFNMLVLWMFGVQMERLWGSRFFIRYYFITGFGAGCFTILASLLPFSFADPTYSAVTIGASGAIYGLLAAFAIYYPETPILMFFLFPVPAKYFVMIIGTISFLSVPRGDGVAHIAHLSGLLVGFFYLKKIRGLSIAGFRFGRGGAMAEIKYRYVKWKMRRLKKQFDVYPGNRNDNWKDRIH